MSQEFKEGMQESIIHNDVIKLFDNLLTYAVEKGASDIHIEPFENTARIRIRVDGILIKIAEYPSSMHDNVISKFKIESGQMKPDEKRLPQDARVSTLTLTNKEIDLRASTMPNIRGEKLVMRIVDKSKKIPALEVLGIEGSNEKIIFKHLKKPNGIILNTGPTGSGKTSTLYACLEYINKIDVNIMTFEDPVENKMPGLAQSQVRPDIGYTFAAGLRSALRQDPDVIMVGEIRDHETLEMAIEAAMTGHLVFSTVHTNSSAETISRVVNLGAKNYMMAGTFNLVMAQRLCRKICPHCKQHISIKGSEKHNRAREAFANYDKEVLREELLHRGINSKMRNNLINEGVAAIGTGKDPKSGEICPVCGGSGHKGRVGVFELMDYTHDIKQMLIDHKTAYEIEQYALKKGMTDLERDGLFKVMKDKTSIDEVYRVITHRN